MAFDSEALGLASTSTRLLRDLVHERLGLFYDETRLDQLTDRLAPLLVQRGFGSFLDYYYLLKYDPAGEAEWPRIMDALAVSETYFWREIDQLRAIVGTVVPRLVERLRGAPLQIWSVPCASGEEPLTVAMLLEEQVRGSDLLARVGGEEFAVLAVEAALSEASQLGERLRACIQNAGPISVSPMARAFSTTPSDSMASSAATIEAIASGCPEYVSPPGNTRSSNVAAIGSEMITPPSGT